jgi:hypothetical protein
MGRMMGTCDSVVRLSLGAYVLGALDPVERSHVEAHLAGCTACRDEVSQLAVLPGLLSRVRVEDVLDPTPPPRMAEQLIARFRAARRARRRRLAVAVSTVAVAAAGVLAFAVATNDAGNPSPPQPVAQVSATNHRTGVAGKMALRPTAWGTAVRVRLRGVPSGTRCRLIVASRSGRRDVAGSWRADYAGAADVETATAIPKDQLSSLEVVTSTGQRLLRASVE